MENILDFEIGLTLGLLNEKNNQVISFKNKDNEEEKIVEGNAEMLMGM